MSNFRKFISMAAVAVLGVTNLLTPLSYATAENLGNYDNITFPVTAKSFSFIMPAHHVYLYAVTEANKYFVEYYGHGSTSGSLYTGVQTYDTTGDLLDNRYEKLGYSFREWNRNESGDGAGYQESATNVVDNWTAVQSGVVPVYAQWDPNRYNIHYDLSDSTGTSSGVHDKEPTSGEYNEELTIPNASRTGYTFSGWYITGMDENTHIIGGSSYSGQTKDHEDATSYSQLRADTGDVYFAARWDPNTNTKYEVRHFLQKFDGTYDSGTNYKDHNEETGTTDTDVQPGVNHYEGYDDATPYTGNINADGSTVFFYHYPRQSHTLTLHAGRGINTVTATGQYNTAGITTNDTDSTGFMYEEPIELSYTIKNGYTGATWSGYLDESSSFTMTGENIEKTAYAEPIVYTITYETYSGTVSPANPGTYTIESSGFTLNNPSRIHSYFAGWTGSNGSAAETTVTVESGSIGDRTYYATYTCHSGYHDALDYKSCIPDEHTQYKVQHWQYDLDGNLPANPTEIETLSGKTDTPTQAVAKDYEGFTVVEPRHQGNISGDVVTVVDIEYSRNSYNLTINQQTGSTVTGSAAHPTGSSTVKYGDTVTLTHSEQSGYTFTGWEVTYTSGDDTVHVTVTNNTFTMPAGPVTVKPIIETNEYRITYILHDGTVSGTNRTTYTVEDDFTLINPTRPNSVFSGWSGTDISGTSDNVRINGKVGDRTYEAVWGCKTGYHADGDSCVNNQYTVSVNYKDEGNAATGDRIVPYTFTYDDPNPTPILNPTQSGYTFAGWTVSGYNEDTATVDGSQLTSPTSGTVFENLTPTSGGTVTLVANWTPNPDTQYVVHYYIKDLGASTYTLTGTYTGAKETNTGITLADEAARNTYSGFTYSSGYVNAGDTTRPTAGDVLETTVDKHGNTVINLYYDRDKYHVYLSGDAHVATLSGENDYYYGEDVTVDMTAQPGYHFKEWRRKANTGFVQDL